MTKITTVPNDFCYEYRGTQAEFDSIKNDNDFKLKTGHGSVFIIISAAMPVYIFDKTALDGLGEWVLVGG